jgi:hypothetical protein
MELDKNFIGSIDMLKIWMQSTGLKSCRFDAWAIISNRDLSSCLLYHFNLAALIMYWMEQKYLMR